MNINGPAAIKHNVLMDIGSLGMLGAWVMHLAPDIALFLPGIYYSLIIFDKCLDYHKRWKNRTKK
jgi:hypothetical protein